MYLWLLQSEQWAHNNLNKHWAQNIYKELKFQPQNFFKHVLCSLSSLSFKRVQKIKAKNVVSCFIFGLCFMFCVLFGLWFVFHIWFVFYVCVSYLVCFTLPSLRGHPQVISDQTVADESNLRSDHPRSK